MCPLEVPEHLGDRRLRPSPEKADDRQRKLLSPLSQVAFFLLPSYLFDADPTTQKRLRTEVRLARNSQHEEVCHREKGGAVTKQA